MHPIQYRHEIAEFIYPHRLSDLRLNELRSLQGAIRNVVALAKTEDESDELINGIICIELYGDNAAIRRARQVLCRIRNELSYRKAHQKCSKDLGFDSPCECLSDNARSNHQRKNATIMSAVLTFWMVLFSIIHLNEIYKTEIPSTNIIYPSFEWAIMFALIINVIVFFFFRAFFCWCLKFHEATDSPRLLAKSEQSRGYNSV
ncbi:unnamed protein product, partial [Mesorhabditis spiculigera]